MHPHRMVSTRLISTLFLASKGSYIYSLRFLLSPSTSLPTNNIVSTAPAPSRRPPAPHLLRDSSHPQPLSSNPVAPGWTPPPYARDAIDQVVDKLLDDDTSMRDADNSSSTWSLFALFLQILKMLIHGQAIQKRISRCLA